MPSSKDLFESIYNDYQAMVYQMCLVFMKGDRDLAKDLSQEVFLNTWSAIGKFNHASSPKTWIYRITVNTCLKHIRDAKDTKRISIDETLSSLKYESFSDLNHQSLYTAIGQLKEVDR